MNTIKQRIAKLETMIRNGRECLALRRRPGMSPMVKEANESFEQMIKGLEKELELLKTKVKFMTPEEEMR